MSRIGRIDVNDVVWLKQSLQVELCLEGSKAHNCKAGRTAHPVIP
jgi:hypothetical protein